MSEKKTDEVVATREIRTTKDLSQFKSLDGNRHVNNAHVKQIQKLMLENGNLTYEFPIIVDAQGYVVDGQHRLEALRGLGWEVGYRVEENATIDTVRAINQGNRNWSWRDMAYSYSSRGNEDYTWFLSFVDQYGLKFHPALVIATNIKGKGNFRKFQSGEMTIHDKGRAHDMARQIVEVQRLVQITNGDFTTALIAVMQSPAYDQERMMHKLRQQGELLPTKARITDYMRRLEDMFNFGFPEDSRARLF